MERVESASMSQTEKENFVSKTVENYGTKLMGFIRSKVRNSEDAEDILQEVWYQFSNLSNLSDIVNVSSWLYTVSRNKITDNYRKKQTENLEDFSYEDEGDLIIREFLMENNDENPELKMFQEQIWDEIFSALEELPETQRLVYTENELEGKTLQQIADEQNENLKTIISRKQYAVKHLRKKLNRLYMDLNNH